VLRGVRAELAKAAGSVALALLLAAASVTVSTEAAAPASSAEDRQAEIRRELDRLRSQFGEAVADEQEALAEYEVSRRAQRRLDAAVAELDAQIAATQAELVAARDRLAAAQAEAEAREQIVEASRQRLAQARRDAEQQAVAAYVADDVRVYHPLLLLALDQPGAAAGIGYVRAVGDHQRRVIADYQAAWDQSQADRDAAVAARQQAELDQAVVAQREAELAAHRAEQAAAQQAAATEVARQRQLVARVQATKERYEARIAALERESANVAAMLRRRQAGQGRYSGELRYPVPGYDIGSSYGSRRHPIFGDVRLHAGIDIAAPTGTAVQAAAAGEVIASRGCGGYGTCVIIDHGGSLATLYAHLSSTRVRLGDRVRAGQVIGGVGATGQATGPHLHFEVRVSGTPVDPMPYL